MKRIIRHLNLLFPLLFLFGHTFPCAAYHEVEISLQNKGIVTSHASVETHYESPATAQILIKWKSTPMNSTELRYTLMSALGEHLISSSVTSVASNQTMLVLQIDAGEEESLKLTLSQCSFGAHFVFYFDRPTDYLTYSSNWIRTRTFTGTGDGEYVHDIAYYDGLGLPEQQVAVAASPSGNSIITPIYRDSMLRTDARKYLPHVAATGSGKKESSPISASKYALLYGPDDAEYPYLETHVDGYASNRPIAEMLPGKVFREENKHSGITYGSNTSAPEHVFKLSLSADAASLSVGYPYSSNSLSRETRTSADGKRHDTYKDKRGNTLLERDWTGDSTYADTYYVYDVNDRLAWIVSPEGSALLNPGLSAFTEDDFAAKWATVYKYDGQNRIIAKRRPGCGWEYNVYDKGCRLVLQQDSLLRVNNRWIYHIYDNLNREINRTLVSSSLSRSSIQSHYDASSFNNTYPSLGGSVNWRVPISTTIFSFIQELETVRYGCDHYRTGTTHTDTGKFSVPYDLRFMAVTGIVSTADVDTTSRGMKIYEKEAILGSAASVISGGRTFVERAFHYDKKGRVVQTVERNVLGGISRTSVRFDFQGHPLIVRETHRTSSTDTSDDIKQTEYTYDARGRVLTETTTLNNGSPATVQYSYDDVGRQTAAIYGNGITDLKTYTTQGWIKNLATVSTAATDPLFTQHYDYWDSATSVPLYDGTISSMNWSNGDASFTLALAYDRMGRLTSAIQPGGMQSLSESGITYDRNGNLMTLNRTNVTGTCQNDMTYTYHGNVLSGINDNGNSYSYGHDGNGNLSMDGKQGVNISYNLLNLPDKVHLASSAGTEKAAFVYLADGTSIGMFAKVGSSYAGNLTLGTMVYEKYLAPTLKSTEFAAGRINASSTGSGTDIWYYTRDHLGSTRLITDADGNVKERSDYYPFGLRMEGGTQAAGNRWRFAGKEEQKTGITLDWLNFGARMYDPCLGRWTTQDPLAEKYPGTSPYAYCAGDPVNLVDLDGADWFYYSLTSNSEPTWNWRDEHEYHTGVYSDSGEEVVLSGVSAVAVFDGARYEHLGEGDSINGAGAITASVTLYGPGGADDISHYKGYTMTSDADKFIPIAEGIYDCNYLIPGKGGKIPSNWALNAGGAVPTMDNKENTSPFAGNNFGLSQKTGIYIHRTNLNGKANSTVSTGCLLLAPQDWADFNSKLTGAKSIKVQVTRRDISEILNFWDKTGLYFQFIRK